MKPLQPDETDLMGNWIADGAKVRGDETSERIQWLISTQLKKITNDKSGWDTLYSDPQDGRFWELWYPQSEMHGGGPPRLTMLPKERAVAKYGQMGLK